MHFPLSDWIDAHADCRFNLGRSGMAGVVEPPEPTAREVAARSPDEWTEEVRRQLGEYLRVDAHRVFLTHGATEANSWVLMFGARHAASGRRTCRVRWPEYPPLVESARNAGFRPAAVAGRVAMAAVSLPRNPEGIGWTTDELTQWTEGARAVLVDETFREFSGRPSRSEAGARGVWTTGSFTKFFGADDVRVGYAVAPPEAVGEFARFHSVAADDVPPWSLTAASQILQDRGRLTRKVRNSFERNRAALRRELPGVPSVDAPVYFDRDPLGDGDDLADQCLRASVLVCPGSLFGASEGVRICLTRRTFPRDLAAYVAVRGERRHRSSAR